MDDSSVTVSTDESGNSYMLIEDPKSWDEARLSCQNAGGQLADITTEEQNVAVAAVMQSAGVMNAWICNEVVRGSGYSNWGTDVDLNAYGAGESKYYSRHECVDTALHECNDQDEECTEYLEDEHWTWPLGGCCDRCPAGYQIRYDVHESSDLANNRYTGPMCGRLQRSHSPSNAGDGSVWENDWAEDRCGSRYAYVCDMSPRESDATTHCYVNPRDAREASSGRAHVNIVVLLLGAILSAFSGAYA